MSAIWPAMWLSIQIAVAATVITTLVGVPLSFVMARTRFVGRTLLDAIILMPLVLPPTVVGYLILMTFGAKGWLKGILHGYSVVFRFEGAVIAAAIVALPMIYLPTKAAFASVDREFEDVARLMGASRKQLFWHVSLPMARRGIASGIVLAFARALGEFGATVMVFGWQPGRVTLPIAIYSDYEQGELSSASAAVVALSAISLGLVLIYNVSAAGRREGAR